MQRNQAWYSPCKDLSHAQGSPELGRPYRAVPLRGKELVFKPPPADDPGSPGGPGHSGHSCWPHSQSLGEGCWGFSLVMGDWVAYPTPTSVHCEVGGITSYGRGKSNTIVCSENLRWTVWRDQRKWHGSSNIWAGISRMHRILEKMGILGEDGILERWAC